MRNEFDHDAWRIEFCTSRRLRFHRFFWWWWIFFWIFFFFFSVLCIHTLLSWILDRWSVTMRCCVQSFLSWLLLFDFGTSTLKRRKSKREKYWRLRQWSVNSIILMQLMNFNHFFFVSFFFLSLFNFCFIVHGLCVVRARSLQRLVR